MVSLENTILANDWGVGRIEAAASTNCIEVCSQSSLVAALRVILNKFGNAKPVGNLPVTHGNGV
jgi:hypothetical protein